MTPQWGLSKRSCPKCLMNLQVNCGTGSLAATHRQHLAICQRHASPFSPHAWLLSQCWAHDGCLHRPTGEEVSYQSLNEWFIFLIGEGSQNLDEGQTMGQDEFDMCVYSLFQVFFARISCSSKTRLAVAWPTASAAVLPVWRALSFLFSTLYVKSVSWFMC